MCALRAVLLLLLTPQQPETHTDDVKLMMRGWMA